MGNKQISEILSNNFLTIMENSYLMTFSFSENENPNRIELNRTKMKTVCNLWKRMEQLIRNAERLILKRFVLESKDRIQLSFFYFFIRSNLIIVYLTSWGNNHNVQKTTSDAAMSM